MGEKVAGIVVLFIACALGIAVISNSNSNATTPGASTDTGGTKPIVVELKADQTYNEPNLDLKNAADANKSNAEGRLADAQARQVDNEVRLVNEEETDEMVGEAVQWAGRIITGEEGVTSAERGLQRLLPLFVFCCFLPLVVVACALFLVGRRTAPSGSSGGK